MLGAELKDRFVELGEVRSYDECEAFALFFVEPLGLQDDLPDQWKVEQRLATLELDLELM
jgi:hypothetical protein